MNDILDDQMVDSVELKCLVVSRGLKGEREVTPVQLLPGTDFYRRKTSSGIPFAGSALLLSVCFALLSSPI